MNKPSPCLNCTLRSTYCHGSCKAYTEWRAAKTEQNRRDHDFAAYQFADLSSAAARKRRQQAKTKRELKK